MKSGHRSKLKVVLALFRRGMIEQVIILTTDNEAFPHHITVVEACICEAGNSPTKAAMTKLFSGRATNDSSKNWKSRTLSLSTIYHTIYTQFLKVMAFHSNSLGQHNFCVPLPHLNLQGREMKCLFPS